MYYVIRASAPSLRRARVYRLSDTTYRKSNSASLTCAHARIHIFVWELALSFIFIVRRSTPGPRVVRVVFPCILRLRSTACYSELIEESVCLFAMDSTRRKAALAR